MKNIWSIGLVTTFVLLQGCAHNHSSGSVLLTDHDGGAHVCLGEGEVSVGDAVDVFNVNCEQKMQSTVRTARVKTVCKKTKLGDAKVVEVTDDHFSRIEPTGALQLKAGQIVERKAN